MSNTDSSLEPQGIKRDEMDPSEDSGFSNLSEKSSRIKREDIDPSEDSGFSNISEKSSISVASEKDGLAKIVENGVEFVDPQLIEEEQRKKLEKIKKKSRNSELIDEQRQAREAYEKDIQEQQYKRLMHLLTKSKAFHSFLLKKTDDQEEKSNKRLRQDSNSQQEPPKKRGRKPKNSSKKINKVPKKNKKLNLSEEDIEAELMATSDEENKNENDKTETDKNFKPPKYFKGQLREHQIVGLNWLRSLYENGLNGILADEMGLGKTIQVIALFSYLLEKQTAGPYLIVVPLSTLANWKSEFERFAPELPLVTYYGNGPARQLLQPKLSKKVRIGTFTTLPIVLTTYEVPAFDTAFMRKFNWRYIVVDEAQRIKNYKTQLFKILKSFNSYNRLLLTGTPLQNNLSELWSLLNFLLPEIFDNLGVFESWFDAKSIQNKEGKEKFLKQEQEKQVLATLREILQPFMLRRLKEEACPEIPPLKEVLVHTPLTSVQYELYSAILNRDIAKLYRVKEESLIVDVDGVRPKRKCTSKVNIDDYYLTKKETDNDKIREMQKEEWSEFTNVTDDNFQYFIRLRFGNNVVLYKHVINHPYIINYPLDSCGLPKIDDNLIKVSGKILVLDAMLKKLQRNGHKVLLFSTMTMVLDVIEDYLSMRDFKYVRLDGSVKYEDRRANIDEFQTNPEVFLFLLTTKAGAVGLNLAAADTVIIYDSDWNPQNDIQAMSRCHRIGQTRPVVVYRMCTRGTIDEEIIKRASAKRFLEKAVIEKESGLVNSEEGLMKLKKILDENLFKITDSKISGYTDEELDKLLDRNTII